MVSDAAKKKAAAKRLAAVAKRTGVHGKDTAASQVVEETFPVIPLQSHKGVTDLPDINKVHLTEGSLGEKGSRSADDSDDEASSRPESRATTACRITFPPSLTPRQRAIIHEVAEEAGFDHGSTGQGEANRRLVVWRDGEDGEHFVIPHGDGPGGGLSDARLAEVVGERLGLKAQNQFLVLARNAGTCSSGSSAAGGSAKASAGQNGHQKRGDAMTLDGFVSRMLPLLDLEKEMEIEKTMESTAMMTPEKAQKLGRSLLNLKCTDAQAGLLGKTLLVLEPNRGDLLPPHKFTPHDVVSLRPNRGEPNGPSLGQGVVYRLRDSSITVAMDDVPEDGLDAPLRLEKVANEVTYKRMKDTLATLSRGVLKGPASDLVPVLFGSRSPSVSKKPVSFSPINKALDPSQRAAVAKALGATDVMLLHGPPGTGKTTAIVEIILQEVKRGAKVLACAASNIAVDNLVERLARHKTKLVRMGHPARLLPQVLESALDAQVMRADNSALANDVAKEMKQANSKLIKTRDKKERGELRRELKRLAKEQRQRQAQAVVDVLKASDVILTTLTGALTRQLEGTDFDLVVIDEAAQALECACWIALLKGRRCVLAGDHLQLPPTVQSPLAEKGGLGVTLFERVTRLYGDAVTSMLTVQYRMNSSIMQWSSDELYNSKVTADKGVAGHRLCDLPGVKPTAAAESILVLIDTAGCEMEEQREEDGDSTGNDGEAQVVMAHVKRLVDSGVDPSDIGIITPYSAQVGRLKAMRSDDRSLASVEISTVDGFQGREKEAIVISMVRSNDQREVGFLADSRRMNVAVTRARRQCCVVCDSETVNHNPFLKRMVDYFEQNGEYLSAMEYTS